MRRGRKPARKMVRGGRTRPAPRGRGRKMPGGGRTCGGMNQPPCPGGGGYRKGGRTRPAPRGRGRAMARGGATRGGRPAPRSRGGRAPVRRFQGGGGVECPAGTFKTADGLCTPMGS